MAIKKCESHFFNCKFGDKQDPLTLNRFVKMRFRIEIQTNWLGAITGMMVDLGMPLISFFFFSHFRLVSVRGGAASSITDG